MGVKVEGANMHFRLDFESATVHVGNKELTAMAGSIATGNSRGWVRKRVHETRVCSSDGLLSRRNSMITSLIFSNVVRTSRIQAGLLPHNCSSVVRTTPFPDTDLCQI